MGSLSNFILYIFQVNDFQVNDYHLYKCISDISIIIHALGQNKWALCKSLNGLYIVTSEY